MEASDEYVFAIQVENEPVYEEYTESDGDGEGDGDGCWRWRWRWLLAMARAMGVMVAATAIRGDDGARYTWR